LELEIAERCLAVDPERSRSTLAELRAAGVRIAVADFGTGYSSYLTLRQLVVDRLKIDRTFTNGMLQHAQDRVIVQSAIDLAHGFGIAAAADAVECDSTWIELAAMGCDIAQGDAFAPAMSIEQLATWMNDPTAARALQTQMDALAPRSATRSVGR
jgi:EAL domain-containing protein (putative c-di-GMP-specific phosphodiesterase class I)